MIPFLKGDDAVEHVLAERTHVSQRLEVRNHKLALSCQLSAASCQREDNKNKFLPIAEC
jgi:hypothetical protein